MGLGPQRKDSKTFGTTVYGLTHPSVCIEAPLENMSISPSIYLSQYQQRQKAIFRNSNTYCTII